MFVMIFAAVASAECPSIDFEGYAPGTIITTQYSGITFSAPDQYAGSCAGDAVITDMTPYNGTYSPTQAISTQPGFACEFSPEFLQMVFSVGQDEVRFSLGPIGTITVDAYDSPSGGTLLSSQSIFISGFAGYNGVYHPVTVSSGANNIRRIEINGGDGVAEAIDDLILVDNTPPIAEIETPSYEACVCDSVDVYGQACDTDGDYGSDKLEYQKVNSPPGTAWTLIGSFTSPACGNGNYLYTWNTAAIAHGYYYLKLTVTNACGLVSTDVTVVHVDKLFNAIDFRYPDPGDVIGGNVCMDGTVSDSCLASYTVLYQPAAGGSWNPVDPMNPSYNSNVINDPFAYFDTTTGATPDGDYNIEVAGTDLCGNFDSVTHAVTVDNTPPTAIITDPISCMYVQGVVNVIGTADDTNLSSWVLQYTGDGIHGWVTIDSGTTSIVGGLLGKWDTTLLDVCAYTLRLVVWDKARNCGGSIHRSEYTVSVNVGWPGDLNGDGKVDILDLSIFSRFWWSGV